MIAEVPEGMSLLEALSAKRESAITSIAELESSIFQIDAVMKMYDPKHVPWKAGALAPVPTVENAPIVQSAARGDYAGEVERFFGSDERTAVVKKIMADANRSMSSADIADAYVDFKGTRLAKEPLQLLISRISAILSRLRKQGKVETVDTDGWKNSWRLS